MQAGEQKSGHICHDCSDRRGLKRIYPDSKGKSFLCVNCAHFGIGSMRTYVVGDWGILKIHGEKL